MLNYWIDILRNSSMPFKQKIKRDKIVRRCPICERIFYCRGRCGDSARLKYSRYCECQECVTTARLSGIEVLLERKDCPNYRYLTEEEIFKECYGEEVYAFHTESCS